MSSLPFPIPAVPISVWAAASHVAPGLVAPFFRRMMLTPRRDARPAPRLGQHTDEVLASVLGLSDGEIGKLRDRRVVAGPG